MGGSPSHPPLSRPPTNLRGIRFGSQRAAFGSPGEWSPNTVFFSWWKLRPLFQGALHHHRGLFSAHPLSAVLQYNSITLFTFIDLLHKVHFQHIFMLMRFAIVLGQFSYIYNLGETGCYSFGIYGIPKNIVYIVWRMVKFDIMKIRKVFPVEGFW
jgi:hypothetical protein